MYKMHYVLVYFLILSSSAYTQKILSVLYFDNTTADPEYQWLSKGLADMLISDLSGIPDIKIIERESLEKVLQEQALSLTGLTEEGSAVEVGKLLQADQLIYGAYIINDDVIRIDMKLVAVESGIILHTLDVKGDIDDIFELETELVTDLRLHLNLKEQPVPRRHDTKSVDALARYYIGIDHLDHKRYTQAESEFAKATELDPLFYRAQEGLAEAYKFLKAFKKHRQQREIAQLYAKINNLRERIEAPKFFTFADIVMSSQYQSLTPEQQQEWNFLHNEYLICNTPAQCTWNIMLTLDEIGRKSAEYFNDTDLEQKMWQQVVDIGEKSRTIYANDPFLSEILYIQLLTFYSQKDYQQLKSKTEEFLMTYPDYRMIETVEDWYEKALENLSPDN
jgi:TolB-like protein